MFCETMIRGVRWLALSALLAPLSLSAGNLFTPVQIYNFSSECTGTDIAPVIAVADISGDGKPDLVVACFDGNNGSGSVNVLLGNGDGTFQPFVSYPEIYSPRSVAIADVNGDGKPDLLVLTAAAPLAVGVMLGNGDGTFQPAAWYSFSDFNPALSFAVADLNNDGKLDLIIAGCINNCTNGAVAVLLGNGDGTFQMAGSYGSGGNDISSVAVGDVNGDGKFDVVVTNLEWGTVGLLLGNGDGTFQPVMTYSGFDLPWSIVITEVNGDGKPDLVIASYSKFPTVAVMLGNGDGTFQPAVTYRSGGHRAVSAAVAAVNGNGKSDLLVAVLCDNAVFKDCSPTGGGVNVLLGNGDGTFEQTQIQKYPLGLGALAASSMIVTDLNGDGKPDVVVAGCLDPCNGAVGILLGTTRLYTTTILNSSPNPSTYGQAVTLTATVSSAAPGGATGKVTFKNGTTSVGTATVSGGLATLTTNKLPAGTLSITATYGGDSNSARSTSTAVSQVVSMAATTTTVTSSPNPSVAGQNVKFTATVKSPTVVPVGTVTFTTGTTTLGTISLAGGKASLTTSALPAGTTTVTATYNGTSNITGSLGSVVQTVN
jgi:hypothetical protein